MVQDLRELSLALVARMMDPRLLLAQARAARLPHSTSPCKPRVNPACVYGRDPVCPRCNPNLHGLQARAARFLLGAFPCKWGTIVIVDAPASFGGLWRAAANFLPVEFAESVQFMYRPEAEERLERMFGRRVL